MFDMSVEDIKKVHTLTDLNRCNNGNHSVKACTFFLFRLQSSEWHSGRYALHLASLDALRAHADAHILAVNACANCLQVRAEAALIADM